MKKIKIKVTAEHIDKGKRNNCRECPVALAIKEQLNLPYDMQVGTLGVNIFYEKHTCTKYMLSRAAERFINKFDGRKDVKPFNFVMTEKEEEYE